MFVKGFLKISFQIPHSIFFHDFAESGTGDGVTMPNGPANNGI
jgi:hypothetical protein